MKYYRLHENPDTVLTSPQYFKHYSHKIEEQYPDYSIEIDEMVPAGYSYLINKDKLIEQYKEVNENRDTSLS